MFNFKGFDAAKLSIFSRKAYTVGRVGGGSKQSIRIRQEDCFYAVRSLQVARVPKARQ